MSKTTKKQPEYQLSYAEVRIIEWIRRNSNAGDWTGTIRFVSGPNIYQMANHVKSGQVNGR